MEIINNGVNIFVFGDLVLDHLIPVVEKTRPHQTGAEQLVRDGRLRMTIAGGAANCARVIAALNSGRTCLWGLSGYSPWGAFPQILQQCHAIDGAESGAIYHGSHQESHQMNTINRNVLTDSDGRHHREYRVDDVHDVPVTDTQALDAVGHLRAESKEHGVNAIIFNDLDMKALNESLIADIGEFASLEGIPVFVDPKRSWEKYRSITVECALPNFEEWCYIVDGRDSRSEWKKHLNTKDGLELMANRTLRIMPKSKFHIIKCDKDGAVFIGPKGSDHRFIAHILPHPIKREDRPYKLGPGDILVGALALEYAKIKDSSTATDRMLTALEKANAVVACYLELDWQRVPNEREMDRFTKQPMRTEFESEVPEGVLWLPPGEFIELSDFSIHESELVTADISYKRKVDELVEFFIGGWDSELLRSAILTGRGGIGKSALTDILKKQLPEKIVVWAEFNSSACPNVEAAVSQITEKWTALQKTTEGLLIVIDEAFSAGIHLLTRENGKMLLQQSTNIAQRTRFLFTDADYHNHETDVSESQFKSRCKTFELPSLDSRKGDIAYIFAAGCVRALQTWRAQDDTVDISEAVLLSVINWVLEAHGRQSPRTIREVARETVERALNKQASNQTVLEISKRHLPTQVFNCLGKTEGKKRLFRFSWMQGRRRASAGG